MAIELPAPIAAYFQADRKGDPQLLSHCFTPTAKVIDEGNIYEGRQEIAQWIAGASTQYTYTAEPFEMFEQDGRVVVTSHLVGNFPGSPVNLRYLFDLAGDEIAALEIVP